MSESNTSSNEKRYFDLHLNGIGYLNRIREVAPDRGEAYLACDIAALNGPCDDASYVKFDTRVSGSEAQQLVRRCEQAVQAEKKVLIAFRLGDLRPEIFIRTRGENAGKPAVSLKARLLLVTWIKVEDEVVYKAEPKPADADGRETEAAESSTASSKRQRPEPQSSKSVSKASRKARADTPAAEDIPF